MMARPDGDESEAEDALCFLRQTWATVPRNTPVMVVDLRDAVEVEDEEREANLVGYQAKQLKLIIPVVGRGDGEAKAEASRKRRSLVHPYPGGIYAHFGNIALVGDADGFRQMMGWNQVEFDEFYTQTVWAALPAEDTEPVLLPRPWFFAQARNNLGKHSPETNEQRRTIRGLLEDRDRVLCWLQMLRRDTQFGEMEAIYGPSRTTFHNDFKDMTSAAQNMPCLLTEIHWPDALERKLHADFLIGWGHPEFPRVAYFVGGTKVIMRNPSRVGKGREEPHDAVHDAHHSRNIGLGCSHIVYCNFRGKIIRIETVKGSSSDRGAHLSWNLYLESDSFLSEGETGMRDGHYRGPARAGNANLMMCVPKMKSANVVITASEKRFNGQQRRFRVVVENTIGQIKKWKAIGGKAFRHQRDFENEVFDVSARLATRIMRVRNQYPRSLEWTTQVMEGWEAKLGVHIDPEDPGSYLVHSLGEDVLWGVTHQGAAANLQSTWADICGMSRV